MATDRWRRMGVVLACLLGACSGSDEPGSVAGVGGAGSSACATKDQSCTKTTDCCTENTSGGGPNLGCSGGVCVACNNQKGMGCNPLASCCPGYSCKANSYGEGQCQLSE